MGIQDRDYYRREGPSVFDALLPSGVVCRWLIAINVVVWCLQLLAFGAMQAVGNDGLTNPSRGWITDWLILDPLKVMHGEVWRLLTYAFLHDPGGFYHILFNMIFLWWFGSDLEQLYGRKEFLAIYLFSAILGGAAYTLWCLTLGDSRPCLGASGAVTTLLVLCACHFPHRVIYLFMILPVPIWFLAVFSVASDTYIAFSNQRTGVAVVVHLAGAAFALAYFKGQHRLTDFFSGLMFWKGMRPRSQLKIFRPEPDKEEPVAVSAVSAPTVMDEHLEAKLDAVLEKIATKGKASLTAQEQEVLKQAAEMYKRRRT